MVDLKSFWMVLGFVFIGMVVCSCVKVPVMTLEEIENERNLNADVLVQRTVSKPKTEQPYVNGEVGGTWTGYLTTDPKTFNQLIAERDSTSAGIVSQLTDYLVDYDTITKKWKPRAAFFEIETKNDSLIVHYTLRDNLFWSYFNSDKKIAVTSDDIVFWYNEIAGDIEFQSSAYTQQFVTMPDGSQKHIDCIKIDDKRFDFVFPRIVADPLLATNMEFAPSFVYKKAKEENGTDGIKKIFSIDMDPTELPSMGRWFVSEYSPAQRLVFSRNPDYWEKDNNGVSYPYYEKEILQIVGDMNTAYLLFNQGKQDSCSPQPENLDDVINAAADSDYTVYNAEGSLSAQFWSFNQNPINKSENYYSWFTNKKFRQAMSCLLNRDRIINQTYRGLANAKYDFFPDANPYYDPEILLEYKYDVEKALSLLKEIGIKQDSKGIMRDKNGNQIEYDLTIASGVTVTSDIAQIITDELSKVGIKVNIRQTDFQKVVEMLTTTYDWQSVIIALGSNFFPSQGSNVWPSSGNLHLWYPLQKKPNTDWEARVDYLYNEGCYTIDVEKADKIWDEYQKIFLEECPLIYLVCPRSFFAISNKWDFSNFSYDNKNGAITDYIFLRSKYGREF